MASSTTRHLASDRNFLELAFDRGDKKALRKSKVAPGNFEILFVSSELALNPTNTGQPDGHRSSFNGLFCQTDRSN